MAGDSHSDHDARWSTVVELLLTAAADEPGDEAAEVTTQQGGPA
jgi:hypothetical protein